MSKTYNKGDKPGGHPLPFECVVLDAPEVIKNPFSGESIELQPDAVAVYDNIMGAQLLAEKVSPTDGGHKLWDTVRKGCDWFRQYYAKEYMVLLD